MSKLRSRTHKIKLPRKQTGAALLLFILLLVVGATTMLVSKMNKAATQYYRDDVTMTALMKAKEALIGYAVSYPDNPKFKDINAGPGFLPCPDTDGDGEPNGACGGAPNFALGRLPWVEIGLDDVRDSAGEQLWYSLSNNYRNNPKTFPLNSETVGELTLNGNAAGEVVAVIMAPGFSFDGQNRPSNTASDYLEDDNKNTVPNKTNANFVSFSSGDFNDNILVITKQELMAAVEKRVMGTIAKELNEYRNRFGGGAAYPWLNNFRNPRVYLPGPVSKDEGTISGTISLDSTVSLVDGTKDFGVLQVKAGDVFFNVTRNEIGVVAANSNLGDNSISINSIDLAFPVSFISGDNYNISRFNGEIFPGSTTTKGLLPIHHPFEAFNTGFDINWSLTGATETVCSQLDALSLPDNEASAHIEDLINNLHQQIAPLTVQAIDNVCIWENENTINCVGFLSNPPTFSGTTSSQPITPCSGLPTFPASSITQRRFSFRLNFNAESTTVPSPTVADSKIRNLATNFTIPITSGVETEILIQDLNASGDVLGEARLITPIAGSSLSLNGVHMDLGPLGGIATGGNSTTLTDTNKDFIQRGIAPGDWVVNKSDNSRGRVLTVTSPTTLKLTALSNGTSNTFSANDFYQIYNELPQWFTYNNWHHLNYVVVSSDNQPGGTGTCTASTCLSISDDAGTVAPNNDNKEAIVISAGKELSVILGQNRNSGTVSESDYFENGNVDLDLVFDVGSFDPTLLIFNDQIKRVAPCPPKEIDNCY